MLHWKLIMYLLSSRAIKIHVRSGQPRHLQKGPNTRDCDSSRQWKGVLCSFVLVFLSL